MKHPPVAQTFWEHVGSLRNYLLAGGATLIAFACLALFFIQPLILVLLAPLHGQELVFLSVLGPFLFQMKVAFLAALVPSVPVWIALLFGFVGIGAASGHRTATVCFVAAAGLLAATSVVASYLLLVPTTLRVLTSIAVPGTTLILTADSYLDFFFLETIVAFTVLQLPLAINALTYLRLLDPTMLAGKRRGIYLALAAGLALVTPTTDIVSLIFALGPAVLFMEGGIAVARVIHTRRSGATGDALN